MKWAFFITKMKIQALAASILVVRHFSNFHYMVVKKNSRNTALCCFH